MGCVIDRFLYSDLKVIIAATPRHITPKAAFRYFCGSREVSTLPTPIPTMLPAANGSATPRGNFPVDRLAATPVSEKSAITPSEVATTDCTAKSVKRCKAGTMTNPPPTPSKPDRMPAMAPAIDKAPAHLLVQINRPLMSSRMQGRSRVREVDSTLRPTISRKVLYATQARIAANNRLSSRVSKR